MYVSDLFNLTTVDLVDIQVLSYFLCKRTNMVGAVSIDTIPTSNTGCVEETLLGKADCCTYGYIG